MTGLLDKFLNWLHGYVYIAPKYDAHLTGRGLKLTWQPCDFDCYDEGGCDHCAAWVEWEDPDYGPCGAWHHPGDERPDAYLTRKINYNTRDSGYEGFTYIINGPSFR